MRWHRSRRLVLKEYDCVERFAANAAEHPSEEVRAAGIEAIMHAGWPRFAELLRAMAERDPSRSIRKLAKRNASVLEARIPAAP
ncbi:hypothetical protein GCM10017786_32400 [Amycolatopsis deserti]|uniref:HEAT repeat domain-containing protein n=1 Tax=Amycolatopsis deserti TaxID=185696 RepID=A0ABQ3IWV5_9PSEU|nr:hypothetical protein [Amycolatopsis deserti]GHE97237.1 hypothetical protein GCM10017786_32400 [Amycolatopsis deserti]